MSKRAGQYSFDVNEATAKWSQTISEATGVSNPAKLKTIATMMQITEGLDKAKGNINESGYNLNEAYGFAATNGMPNIGGVTQPANPVGGNHAQTFGQGYQTGSDMATARLGVAMNIAGATVGLDMLPVIPIDSPNVFYGFFDVVYAGGRIDNATDKIDYITINGGTIGSTIDYTKLVKGANIFLTGDNAGAITVGLAVQGVYLGQSRLNGKLVFAVQAAGSITALGVFTPDTTTSVAAVIAAHATHIVVTGSSATQATVADLQVLGAKAIAEEVSALDNHIAGASTVSGLGTSPDDRSVAEQGTTRAIGGRFFTKAVTPGEFQILGTATRQQVRDLGRYGIDVYAELFRAAQNELTQSLNKDILTNMFRLGVTTAAALKTAKKIDLNLYLANGATPSKAFNTFGFLGTDTGEFKDITGTDKSTAMGTIPNAETNSAAENHLTRTRWIQSKIAAASSLIGNLCRAGIGDIAVVNEQVKAAIRDSINNPTSIPNTIAQSTASLYLVGKLGDTDIFCDPNMDWNDTRIMIGRRGTDKDSGLKFMPYDLVSSVDIISEGTMSFKFLVSTSYALVAAGFHPEVNYLTIALQSDLGTGFV